MPVSCVLRARVCLRPSAGGGSWGQPGARPRPAARAARPSEVYPSEAVDPVRPRPRSRPHPRGAAVGTAGAPAGPRGWGPLGLLARRFSPFCCVWGALSCSLPLKTGFVAAVHVDCVQSGSAQPLFRRELQPQGQESPGQGWAQRSPVCLGFTYLAGCFY